jgi:multicomponent Na+:H+ antiporter subunit E
MKTYVIHLIIAAVGADWIFRFVYALPHKASTVLGAFIAIYALLWLLSFFYDKNHFRKAPKIINLSLFFIKELIVASLKVAYEVITIKHYMKPGVVAYKLEAKTDLEIIILANLISLTPGTLSIDVSEDRTILYMHALYVEDDPEELKRSIRNGFEKKLLEITR